MIKNIFGLYGNKYTKIEKIRKSLRKARWFEKPRNISYVLFKARYYSNSAMLQRTDKNCAIFANYATDLECLFLEKVFQYILSYEEITSELMNELMQILGRCYDREKQEKEYLSKNILHSFNKQKPKILKDNRLIELEKKSQILSNYKYRLLKVLIYSTDEMKNGLQKENLIKQISKRIEESPKKIDKEDDNIRYEVILKQLETI